MRPLAWGADLPTALVGYGLLIVMASILISTRFGFFVTVTSAIYLIPIWHLQSVGLLIPFKQQKATDGDAITLGVLYCLIMIVAWLSNREIEKSLARARQSERELKEERDSLEVKVVERTRELQEAQLEKMENVYRLAAFGDLASGLFHDLINMMMSLMPKEQHDADTAAMSKTIIDFAEGMRRQLQQRGCQPVLFFE